MKKAEALSTKEHNYIYCGFWIRFYAYGIDALLASVMIFLIWVLLFYVFGDGNILFQILPCSRSYNSLTDILSPILAILIPTLFNSSRIQGTPGKYLLGIKIINVYGNKISLLRALARSFLANPFYIINSILYIKSETITIQKGNTTITYPRFFEMDTTPEIFFGVIMGLLPLIYCLVSVFLIAYKKEKTALHDIICSTRVVKKSIIEKLDRKERETKAID